MNQKIYPLREGILKTVAFFDGLSLAVTEMEVWEYGFFSKNVTFTECKAELDTLISENVLFRNGAFIALAGHELLIEERVEKGMNAEEKYMKFRSAMKLLRFVPYVRMVGICNTLAFGGALEDSDIDVFIVTKRKNIFSANVFSTLLLHLMRKRLHGTYKTNRICLSFFVSETGLDMSRFELQPHDPYLAQWTKSVVPIFNIQGTYQKYISANTEWLKKYFGQIIFFKPTSRFVMGDTIISRSLRGLLEILLLPLQPLLEALGKKYKLYKSRKLSAPGLVQCPTSIVIDNQTIKLHEEDRREFFRDHMNTHA